jgi:hypothetical protein
MKKLDKLFFGLVFGFIFPVMIGLLSVAIWFFTDRQEPHAPVYAVTGLSGGLLIDVLFLKRWINKRYVLPIWFVAGIYILCNIASFGFFMGFPVFNVFLGLLAGYYFGNRICSNQVQPGKRPKLLNQVSLFTGVIMTLICVSSAIITLTEKTIGANIQGMLGLGFEITKPMILAVIFVGGFGLIVSEYFITKWAIIKTIRLNKAS